MGGNAFWNFRRQGGVKTWKPSVVGYGYFLELPNVQLCIKVISLTCRKCMLHTLGQNVALILHDVLGAKVPLSGTIENGSNTCHWKFVTSSLTNKE